MMLNNILENIRKWYQGLPDKKRYVEFITAILTVPVLLTVLITNLSNLNDNKKENPSPTSFPQITKEVITEKVIYVTDSAGSSTSANPTLTPTSAPLCKKQVGPVTVVSPAENQLVTSNNVCLQINYQAGEYCPVVYSYRIDDDDWSDYGDKSICLYNLTSGPKTLELRIKSAVSGDEITLVRNFYYKSKEVPTPTQTVVTTP